MSAPSEREIRDQIERITSSAAFRTSDRLKHFIRFVTSQALQGKGDNLKEYAVGVQVFGREAAFDPRTDPVVRVQARRLRARLERYYHEEGQHDEMSSTCPRAGTRRCSDARVQAPPKPVALASPQENTVAVQQSPICPPLRSRTLLRRSHAGDRPPSRPVKGLRIATAYPPPGFSPAMVMDGTISRGE